MNNERGFTLVELMVATFLLSMLSLIVWSLLGQFVYYAHQAEGKTELYNSLRLSLNRMSREIKYARSITAGSDREVLSFVNANGDAVSYYCANNQLLRREKGVAAPLSGNVERICFSYVTKDGLVIDQTNIAAEKLSPEWTAGLSSLWVELTAAKPGTSLEPAALARKINLRVLP